jgi:ribosomal-protein-alanine N-acetyltransferase
LVPIETPRLILRPFADGDAEDIFKVFSDPETMKYFMHWLAESVDDVRGFIEWIKGVQKEHGFSYWAMQEKATGDVIGDCGLIPLSGEGPDIELGCDVRRDKWNHGYALEASRASLDYGFQVLNLEHIVAATDPRNQAAQHVLEKLGFIFDHTGPYWGEESYYYTKRNPSLVKSEN